MAAADASAAATSETKPRAASTAGAGRTVLNDFAATLGQDPAESEILERLKKNYKPKKKQQAGATWDGRASSVSLKEWRERKWSVDAGYSASLRGRPSYSMRVMLPNPMLPNKRHGNKVFQRGDIHKSLLAVKYSGPSWSMGALPTLDSTAGKSPGPAEYKIKSTMDPLSHPTIPKDTGPKMGTEVLAAKDNVAPPGPGEYEFEAYKESSVIPKRPNYTIQGREAWLPRTEAPSAGPGEYKYEHCMKNGKITPLKWTAQGKTAPIEPARGAERLAPVPPPWHYDVPFTAHCKNHFASQYRPPQWSSSREPRGLL